MIEKITFVNFKALRDATLPLGPFTLIVGPNGSGKSTAMQALRFASDPHDYAFSDIVSAGWERYSEPSVEVSIVWAARGKETTIVSGRTPKRVFGPAQQ